MFDNKSFTRKGIKHGTLWQSTVIGTSESVSLWPVKAQHLELGRGGKKESIKGMLCKFQDTTLMDTTKMQDGLSGTFLSSF